MADTSESDTRVRILGAAREILITEGFGALSMRKVGAAVGVSAPAIYRHFDSRDALLSAAIVAGATTFMAYLLEGLSETTSSARLRRMGQRYLAFAEEHWSEYQLLFVVDCGQIGLDEVDERAQAATSQSFQLLVDRVIECQQDGVFIAGDPTEQAVFIWSSLHGLACVWLTGRMNVDESSYRHLAEQQIGRIFAALSPATSNARARRKT